MTIFNIIGKLAFAQTEFPNLTFRSITTKDGLTSNEISGITQDDNNQIWIATGNGLNSYDGNKITNYYQGDIEGLNLNSNYGFELIKDINNNLWLNDRTCLTRISLNQHTSKLLNQFQDLYKISPYKNGVIITSSSGVFTVEDSITNLNIAFEPYITNKRTIDHYYGVVLDKKENIYLTSSIRVHKISKEGLPRRQASFQEKYYQIPTEKGITNIYFDQQNNGWISTWTGGLFLLEPDRMHIKQFLKPEHTASITGVVAEWNLGEQKYLVVSYSNNYKNGFILIDKKTFDYKIYELSAYVTTIFVDKENNLWLGTEKGILIASHLIGKITSIPLGTTKSSQLLQPGNIYTIHETKDHFWLTIRYGRGIFKYDKNWNLIHEFGSFKIENIPNYEHISDGFDFKLVGNTMYSTSDLGMFMIDNTTNNRTHILAPDRSEVKLRNIIPVNDSTWFIRSYDKGIFVFNPKRNIFTKKYDITIDQEKSINNYLFKTSSNVILASTNNLGLFFYDPQIDKFVRKDHPILNRLAIFGVAEDQNKKLWICTMKGIINYDIAKNEIINDFSQYSEMGMAYRVNIDKNNHVWFSNAKGYWSWNQTNKRMLKLNFDSGLITEVDDSYIHIGTDRMIYLGGLGLIHKLNPDIISKQSKNAKIIIANISVNSKSKIPNFTQNKYQLQLPPGSATIDISFAVPDFSMVHSHDYQFKFADDSTWTNTKDGKILIPSLPHGQYEIQMKGISNFTGEDTDAVILEITILPHWYQTWWFRCLVGLAVCALFYGLYRWKLANENEKNKLKSEYEHRMVHLEMQNLRSQMNPHFIFNALNSINGFIVENKTHLASDYLTKFSKLIRMILDHSKSELISLSKELDALNLYVLMEKNRFDQAFDFKITIDPKIDTNDIDLPPLILQPYIENAIWHGLMHQTKQGSIQLNITQHNDRLVFTIEDNGIGRQKAQILKSKKNIKTTSYGMTITLARIKDHDASNTVVVSDLVDNQGEISGTKVVISLKIV
jgi:ligand-binding sensor domain-containing protein